MSVTLSCGHFFMRSILWMLLLMGACLFTSPGKAQLLDSIAYSFQFRPKPAFILNTRNSFITSQAVKIRGVNVGLNFNKTTKVGLGFNWLGTALRKPISNLEEPTEATLRFWFIAPYFEYAFYRSDRWEVSIPIHLGFGRSGYVYEHGGVEHRIDEAGIVLYEPSMTAIFKPIRYLGVGVGTGYRLMLRNNKAIEERFTSPTYTLKFQVYFGEIYRAIAKPS